MKYIELFFSTLRTFLGLYSNNSELRARWGKFIEVAQDTNMDFDDWCRLQSYTLVAANIHTLPLSMFPDDIKHIHISHSNIQIVDIDGYFPRLSTLSMSNNGIRDIFGLINLPHLDNLIIANNEIVIAEWNHLPRRMNHLIVGGNPIRSLDYRGKCEHIDISNTYIKEIDTMQFNARVLDTRGIIVRNIPHNTKSVIY